LTVSLVHCESLKNINLVAIDIAKCLAYQLIDLVESYRDTINSVREIYSGSVSLQLNDTMRILTVFSSILLPLTFLTSIFGMQGFDLNNIQSIPQGFTVLLIAMAVVSMALFYMFWKRQWISIPGNLHKNKQ
jgi:magnesium transporter